MHECTGELFAPQSEPLLEGRLEEASRVLLDGEPEEAGKQQPAGGCSSRGWRARGGGYSNRYVSKTEFQGPLQPSTPIRDGYVSPAYPYPIRIGYGIRGLLDVSGYHR